MQAQEAEIALIVKGCLANDRKAQEALFRHFYSFLMPVAMRYSRDELDGADILNRAFMKIFKSMQTFDLGKGSLYAWTKRIVINEGLDHIKSRAKFNYTDEIEFIDDPAIDNSAINKINAEELMAIIRQLPPATHAVFILYAIEGYKHKEIAEQLQVSEGTSKWHLSEARKTLRHKLEDLNVI
ncbi:MAG: RNA polymerase sigma factor [Daejeonella sp.]